MEPLKYKCDQCDNTYKSKSSLKRHMNSIHFHRRYVCGNCKKEYVRNIDFLTHKIKCCQPIIMKQDDDNITYTKQPNDVQDRITMNRPQISTASTSSYTHHKNGHSIEKTTSLLTGSVAWNAILSEDLEVSDSDSSRFISVAIGH